MYGQPHRMPMPVPSRPPLPHTSYPPAQSYNTQPPAPSSFETRRSAVSDVEIAMNSINSKWKDLPSDELTSLLEDETQQNKIIEEAEQVRQLIHQKETIKDKNKQVANSNLQHEPQLEAAKSKLFETYHDVPKVQEEYDNHKKEIEQLSKNFSPDTTLALLKTAAQQTEEETEGTIDSFLDGDMTIEDFIEKFRKQKMKHHLRKTKADKLEAILRKSHSQYFH